MIRAVLDANVVVSAILSPEGPPGRILSAVRAGRVRLVLSSPILEEIGRVLREPRLSRRHGRSGPEIRDLVQGLEAIALLTPGELQLEVIASDPSDDRYLECAVEGRADWLVSGDAHLLSLREFRGIPIRRPREFLETLEGEGATFVRERETPAVSSRSRRAGRLRGAFGEPRRRERRTLPT
ncbi:MAG TPA: putative toxin-antitoxin system toxin component, PIN family [Planctomycetota bacterium]|jgi:hypothetical protein|nr:putative toxin-antitoxin system toxin component, PIN family [Planctomycetota bacterium]